MKNLSKQENLTYLVVWSLLFATPLLSMYLRTSNDPYMTFDWAEVFFVWRKFGIFLGLFLIHNFLLAPLLIHKHKRALYATITIALMGGFVVYQCNHRPIDRKMLGMRPPHMEQGMPERGNSQQRMKRRTRPNAGKRQSST